jgi:hypothetical protein
MVDLYATLQSQTNAQNIAVFGGLRTFEVFRSQLFLQERSSSSLLFFLFCFCLCF